MYDPVRELLRCYSNIEIAIKLQREDLTAGGHDPRSRWIFSIFSSKDGDAGSGTKAAS